MLPRLVCVLAILALIAPLQAYANSLAGIQRWEQHRKFSRADDSFYSPPDGWEDAKPGEVLRSRKIDAAPVAIFKLGVDAYQLLYRTNGLNDNSPATSVTTVLVPHNYDHDKLITAILYEDSISPDCAPSKRFQRGNNLFKNVAVSYQSLFITTLLHEGWVVTVPDHEGSKNAFLAGPLEGRTVLDGIRATLNTNRVALNKNAKVIGYGYSGGGAATGWAASLHGEYASELNIAGWSMGGTVSDVANWLRYIDGTSGAGFAFAALMGIAAVDDDLHWVRKGLTDKGKHALHESRQKCMYENLFSFTNQKVISDEYFDGGSSFFNNDGAMNALDKYHLGFGNSPAPKAPVVMFHSKSDAVVPHQMAIATAHSWCDQGAKIKFVSNVGIEMGHTLTEISNLPNVLSFMKHRFSGKSWNDNCEFSTKADPWFNIIKALQSLGNFGQQMVDLLGGRIGKSDSILMSKIENHHVP